MCGSVASPSPVASQRLTSPPEDSWVKSRPSADELRRDLLGGADVAAGVVAQVEHDLVGALVEQRLQLVVELGAARRR